MTRRHAVLAAAALLPTLTLHAQTAGAPGAPHAMTRAAGMPLRDGSLAPGMLTVRVVRGSFSNNLPDEDVQLELRDGKSMAARTGPDGRAQFAHLPVGGRVRASVVVDGVRLASDEFEMPAESGIRVLLIAGGGEATASGVFPESPAGGTRPAAVSVTALPPADAPTASGSASGVLVIRAVLAGATLLAFALLFGQRRPRASAVHRAIDDED